jgi:streptogramin lyase
MKRLLVFGLFAFVVLAPGGPRVASAPTHSLQPPPGGFLPLPPRASSGAHLAPALTADIREYPVSGVGTANVITLGPDGDPWFTLYYSGTIATFDPATHTVRVIDLPYGLGFFSGITTGSDGALWFGEESRGMIGRYTLSGSYKDYVINGEFVQPLGLTRGPDGNVWFTEQGCCIARITPSGAYKAYGTSIPGDYPQAITTGPDGNLWFTEFVQREIGGITTAGDLLGNLPANGGPDGITLGPDGNLWFTEYLAGKIGRLSLHGDLTEFALPDSGSGPIGITPGPDGDLWFAEYAADRIGRITPLGRITEYQVPTPNAGPAYLVFGPGGVLYFTEANANQLGVLDPAPATSTVTWQFAPGWNLISLPLQPARAVDAGAFLTALLARSGGATAALYMLGNGGWARSIVDNRGVLTGQSFPLQEGAGYLLYTDRAASYPVSGTAPAEPTTWQLTAGPNLVGIGQGSIAASQVVGAVLRASGGSLAAIYRLSGGQWSAPVVAQRGGIPTGPDFTLVPGQGYLLYTDTAGTLTLEANGLVSAAMGVGRGPVHPGLGLQQEAHLQMVGPEPATDASSATGSALGRMVAVPNSTRSRARQCSAHGTLTGGGGTTTSRSGNIRPKSSAL